MRMPSMRHFTGFFDVAAIVWDVASIVIGQVGGACSVLVDNVVHTIGAPAGFLATMGKYFCRKSGAKRRIFFQFAPPGFNDMNGHWAKTLLYNYLNKS